MKIFWPKVGSLTAFVPSLQASGLFKLLKSCFFSYWATPGPVYLSLLLNYNFLFFRWNRRVSHQMNLWLVHLREIYLKKFFYFAALQNNWWIGKSAFWEKSVATITSTPPVIRSLETTKVFGPYILIAFLSQLAIVS